MSRNHTDLSKLACNFLCLFERLGPHSRGQTVGKDGFGSVDARLLWNLSHFQSHEFLFIFRCSQSRSRAMFGFPPDVWRWRCCPRTTPLFSGSEVKTCDSAAANNRDALTFVLLLTVNQIQFSIFIWLKMRRVRRTFFQSCFLAQTFQMHSTFWMNEFKNMVHSFQ